MSEKLKSGQITYGSRIILPAGYVEAGQPQSRVIVIEPDWDEQILVYVILEDQHVKNWDGTYAIPVDDDDEFETWVDTKTGEEQQHGPA